jgi:hypothetical protein
MGRGVPAPQAHGAGRGVHEVHTGHQARVGGRVGPGFVAIRVAVPGFVAHRGGVEADGENGAADFLVKTIAELEGGGSQVALHPLALGVVHLADPAVLQNREGR